MLHNNSISMMSWNIYQGGFGGYGPGYETPIRETAITDAITEARRRYGTDTLCLTDAYRWQEHYGNDAAIAAHVGFTEARFQALNDDRLNQDNGQPMGIVFATDRPLARTWALDLDTRQGLGAVLDIGKHGLQIANVYLDDRSEDVRVKQIDALVSGLEKDIPTILTGDFNMLRASMKGAPILNRVKDLGVRALASTLPKLRKDNALADTIFEMNKRQAAPRLLSYGYKDADPHKQPTAKAPFPRIFGIDYAIHDEQVVVDNFKIGDISRGASDHQPVIFTATV